MSPRREPSTAPQEPETADRPLPSFVVPFSPLYDSMPERRKLRCMIISMGGERRGHMEAMFADERLSPQFDPPTFVDGVAARRLRNRVEFLRICRQAGLIPDHEWEALEPVLDDDSYQQDLFRCLEGVKVEPGRRGSDADASLHYSVEIWRKAKTINRGRAVLGCTLAHLIAWRQFTEEGFDVMIEDNARESFDCADRIWEAIEASRDCHLRYYGWLGSRTNIEWIYTRHAKATRRASMSVGSAFPFPTTQDIEKDLEVMENLGDVVPESGLVGDDLHQKPGGTPVWGSYAYWISKEAYRQILTVLRTDVGAMMWKNKRARFYSVKPIDKIMPRLTMAGLGQAAVQLASHPAFFRAPMLTSKIHTQWDPEFCRSTELQLGYAGQLAWSELWLTETEHRVIERYNETGEWLTPAQLNAFL